MAKKQVEPPARDVDWILRDRRVIDGLDHLGVELVSVNLYQALLPGITNVTERARYDAFYPWCIHRYAQEGPSERSRLNWIKWLRPLDFAYATASVAHDLAVDGEASAVVGSDLATNLLKGKSASATIEIQSATAVDDKGKAVTGSYFKNPQGGLGQYYRGPLREMGLVREHNERVWPDVTLTNSSGRPLAESVDAQTAFKDLMEVAKDGRATVGEFANIGARVHPRSIRTSSIEQSILRGVFLGTDPERRRGQHPEQLQQRSQSLRLMLDYLHRAELIEEAPDYEFRWACVADALPDGKRWTSPLEFKSVRRAWGTYQRNDALNYALECLFWVVLDLLEEGPRSPRRLAESIADLGLARIPASEDSGSMPALPARVSDMVRACAHAPADAHRDPWGEQSTWWWVDRLQAACGEGDRAQMSAWAVRVLARLVTDRGDISGDPFSDIPGAVDMAKTREVHLARWWHRAQDQRNDRSKDFITRLVIEWVILRHLRVATRKLAGQGVSTYKCRPEEGDLVLVAAKLPEPTFTAPRVRQAYRILADLGLAERGHQGWTITPDGVNELQKGRHS